MSTVFVKDFLKLRLARFFRAERFPCKNISFTRVFCLIILFFGDILYTLKIGIEERKMKEEKTNVMRLLDAKKIYYRPLDYSLSGAISGTDAADALSLPYEKVFKTLVTVGKSGKYYVFDLPVNKELDLKKAATAVGEKNIAMIHSKELLPLTGYIHGGCSPLGMKKFFTTTFDERAKDLDKIVFSAGKIGHFVEINFSDLSKAIKFGLYDLCER